MLKHEIISSFILDNGDGFGSETWLGTRGEFGLVLWPSLQSETQL